MTKSAEAKLRDILEQLNFLVRVMSQAECGKVSNNVSRARAKFARLVGRWGRGGNCGGNGDL